MTTLTPGPGSAPTLWLAGLLVAAGSTATAWGQPAAKKAPTIIDVRIEGNKLAPSSRIMPHLRSRVGQKLAADTVNGDVRRLMGTGLFSDVVADSQSTDRGVVLIFRVVERPLVQELTFQGNASVSTDELKKAIPIAVGQPQNVALAVEGRRRVEELYQERGYPFAKVKLLAGDREADASVVYQIIEGPKVKVAKVDVAGNAAFPTSELKGLVKTAPPILWIFGGKYNAETIKADVNALQQFYRGKGFLDVKVAREQTFSEDRRKVAITYVVQEGAAYTVAGLEFEGSTVFTNEQLQDGLDLQPGLRFDEATMEADRKRLVSRYGQRGYVDAAVQARHRFLREPNQVVIRYTVREDQRYRLREVVIKGNRYTKDNVIRRHVLLDPGDWFDTTKIDGSRQRLRDTGLFKPYRVVRKRERKDPGRRADEKEDEERREPMPKFQIVGDGPDWRDLIVEIEEQDTGMLILGAGVTSDSGLIGTLSFAQRNFDIAKPPRNWDEFWSGEAWRGAGQRFNIVAQPGTELSRFSVDFVEPYLLDQDVSLGVSAFFFQRDRDAWDETRIGTSVRFGRRIAKDWVFTVGGKVQNVTVDDLTDDAPDDAVEADGDNGLVSLPASLTYDVRDSTRYPTEGHVIEFQAEPYGGDWAFLVTSVRARKYWLVYERPDETNQHIVSVRGQIGYMFGDTPIFERFYAGGSRTLRGFDFREAGPHQRGEPIGGDFIVLLSGEYLFPIIDRQFQGVLFMDTGTVEEDVAVTDYRVSVGFGFRVNLDVFGGMPMAFDFGFPLSKGPDDDDRVFSFSVGTTF